MEKKINNSLNRIQYVIFLMTISLLSLYFTGMRFMLCNEAKRASLSLLLGYFADVPFQYRVLVPWCVNLLVNLNLPYLGSPVRIFKIIEFVSIFFLFIAFRTYISYFIKNELRSSIFSLFLFLLLPYQYVYCSLSFGALYYPSDIPSVLFFTLGLIFIRKKNFLAYYPIFIIATFNRETTIFLIFAYLATTIEKNRIAHVLFHCLLQVVIWLLIKRYLAVLFANNPGPGYFVNFFYVNLGMLTNPVNVIRIASSFCFIWIAVISHFKLITDEFTKRSLMVLFPFLSGMFIVGNIIELRIYGEMAPIILSAFLVIINNVFRERMHVQ